MEATADRLSLSGALTVPNAEVIQGKILDAFEAGSPSLTIDVSEASEIDISFLQILIAAQKSASARGLRLVVQSGRSPLVADELKRCGLSSASPAGIRILPELVAE